MVDSTLRVFVGAFASALSALHILVLNELADLGAISTAEANGVTPALILLTVAAMAIALSGINELIISLLDQWSNRSSAVAWVLIVLSYIAVGIMTLDSKLGPQWGPVEKVALIIGIGLFATGPLWEHTRSVTRLNKAMKDLA